MVIALLVLLDVLLIASWRSWLDPLHDGMDEYKPLFLAVITSQRLCSCSYPLSFEYEEQECYCWQQMVIAMLVLLAILGYITSCSWLWLRASAHAGFHDGLVAAIIFSVIAGQLSLLMLGSITIWVGGSGMISGYPWAIFLVSSSCQDPLHGSTDDMYCWPFFHCDFPPALLTHTVIHWGWQTMRGVYK